MSRVRVLALCLAWSLLVAASAAAQTAYAARSANLRAGPGRDYPLVLRIGAGSPVTVFGCLDDWTWCDVAIGQDRGWVYAGNLDFPYQGRRVIVYGNGPSLGFPIISFSLGSYWDNYYRARPWYSRRSYWISRPPRPHRPPGVVRPPRPRPPGVYPPPGGGGGGGGRPPGTVRPPRPRPPGNANRPQPQPPRPNQPRPQPRQGEAQRRHP